MNKYRVLVADDSAFMRKIISDLIAADVRFEVIDTAKNGKEAVEKAKALRPDAITMDVEMPEMNGLDALRQIMAVCPTPVIMLSSLTREGAFETIRALELGAIDFVCKPSGSISLDLYKVKGELIEKLVAAVGTKHRLKPAARGEPVSTASGVSAGGMPMRGALGMPAPKKNVQKSSRFQQLVAIGTSTGGPRALHQVLSQIPGDFPAPILIVQHMPPNFTRSLAQRLDAESNLHVVEGEDGMLVTSGVAYVAPGGWHMLLERDPSEKYRLRLSREAPRGGLRPSVDALFESLVPLNELKRHIVLMTGMGKDGARGMLALKEAGAASTIVESEETCVVYGMPRAAVELGCVMYRLPQEQIAHKLIQLIGT